jgi:hypothetical protein
VRGLTKFLLAVIPLAAMLSIATESVAHRTGDAVGGLLNATLGNLCQIHATFTPVAAYPVIRCPAGFSQRYRVPLVLTTFWIIDASSVGLLSLISLPLTGAGVSCALSPTLTTMTLNHSRLG